jgi:hypothetical protein
MTLPEQKKGFRPSARIARMAHVNEKRQKKYQLLEDSNLLTKEAG